MSGNQEGLTLPLISAQKPEEPSIKSARKYGYEISPSGYKRRINNEGVSMLEAILEKRETDKQVLMLQNRLKRLGYEDQRANKKIEETKRKTEQMLRVKERRQQDMEQKLNLKKNQLNQMMDNRQRFVDEKDRRSSSIKSALAEMRLRNNIMQQEILENRKRNSEAIHQFRSNQQDRKLSMRIKQQEERTAKNQKFLLNRSLAEQHLKDEFGSRQESTVQKAKQNMKELEQKEANMIQKLKHTFQIQQNSFQSFEAVANSTARKSARISPSPVGGRLFQRDGLTSASAIQKYKPDDAVSHQSHDTAQPEVGDRLGRLVEDEAKTKRELQEVQKLLRLGGISLMASRANGSISPRGGAHTERKPMKGKKVSGEGEENKIVS